MPDDCRELVNITEDPGFFHPPSAGVAPRLISSRHKGAAKAAAITSSSAASKCREEKFPSTVYF